MGFVKFDKAIARGQNGSIRRRGETVTEFSLYCMGPRGDATDHGFMRPFLLISVVNGVAILGPATLVGLLIRTAARSGKRPAT